MSDSKKKTPQSIAPAEIIDPNVNINCLQGEVKKREALTSLMQMLPQAKRKALSPLFNKWSEDIAEQRAVPSATEVELFSQLRLALNEATVQGSLGRRDFLKIAGLLMTSGLASMIFPQAADAMVPMAFWKKKKASGPLVPSEYPANTGSDPYWDYVVLCMNMDTPTPSTGFTSVFADESNVGKALTISGSPYIDTGAGSSPYSGRTGSAKFGGSGYYLSFADGADWTLETSSFTFECWIFLPSLPGNNYCIFSHETDGGNQHRLIVGSAGTVWCGSYVGSEQWTLTSANSVISTGQWIHIAYVRNGTALNIYKNGVSVASGTSSASIGDFTGPLYIGRQATSPSYDLNGSLSDLRIYKGVAKYTSNFTPRTTPIGLGTANDPYWGYCVLACPFENSLKDMSGKRIVSAGNTTLTTSQKKYGTASASFNGTSQYLTFSEPILGADDFTLEAWIYLTSDVTDATIFSQYLYSSGVRTMFDIRNRKPTIFQGGSTYNNSTISLNTWTHLAFVRVGSTCKCYIDGILDTTCTSFSTPLQENSWIGAYNGGPTSGYFPGHIDSLRITKGFARYTTDFTPPTASFPVGKDETVDPFWSYTTFLLQPAASDSTIQDRTGRHAITVGNSASISSAQYAYSGMGSVSFNGSNQYLSMAQSTDFQFGTEDFTWEAIVKKTATTSDMIYTIDDGSKAIKFYMYPSTNSPGMSFNLSPSAQSAFNNVWNHISVAKAGNTFLLFANGIKVAQASSATIATLNNGPVIGADCAYATIQSPYFTGFIASMRITKGIARYTHNFTPPTRAMATTQYNPYSSSTLVTSGLVAYLDAGDVNSYPGGGQKWMNLVASPADSSARSAYDFYIGSTSASEASDPTFVGLGGGKSANDYFSFDGGDYLSLATTNSTLIHSLHKAGAQYTLEIWVRLASVSSYQFLMGTSQSEQGHVGLMLAVDASGKLTLQITKAVSGVSSLVKAADTPLIAGQTYMLAVSVDEAGGATGGFLYVNGNYLKVSNAESFNPSYSSPSSANATHSFRIGAQYTWDNSGFVNYLSSGSRIYCARIYKRALSKTELDQNFNATRTRFGL